MFSFLKRDRDKSSLIVCIDKESVSVIGYNKNKDKVNIEKAYKVSGSEKYYRGNNIERIEELVDYVTRVLKGNGIKTKDLDILVGDSRSKVGVYKVPVLGGGTPLDMVEDIRDVYFKEYDSLKDEFNWCVVSEGEGARRDFVEVIMQGMKSEVKCRFSESFKKHGYRVKSVHSEIFSSMLMSYMMCKNKYMLDLMEDRSDLYISGGNLEYKRLDLSYREIVEGIGSRLDLSDGVVEEILKYVKVQGGRVVEGIRLLDEYDIDDREYVKMLRGYVEKIRGVLINAGVKDLGNVMLVGNLKVVSLMRGMFDVWGIIAKDSCGEVDIINNTEKVIDSSFWKSLGVVFKDKVYME